MGENLGLPIDEDQRQFVRESFPVVQDPGAVLFLFFLMVRELDGTSVGNVAIFSFTEYPLSIPAVQSRPFPCLCRKWPWRLPRLMKTMGRSRYIQHARRRQGEFLRPRGFFFFKDKRYASQPLRLVKTRAEWFAPPFGGTPALRLSRSEGRLN